MCFCLLTLEPYPQGQMCLLTPFYEAFRLISVAHPRKHSDPAGRRDSSIHRCPALGLRSSSVRGPELQAHPGSAETLTQHQGRREVGTPQKH